MVLYSCSPYAKLVPWKGDDLDVMQMVKPSEAIRTLLYALKLGWVNPYISYYTAM